MLPESGLTRITSRDGTEFTFRPSFRRIAELGGPAQIVACFVGLYGPRALFEARFVMATLADQDDVTPLIGWLDPDLQDQPGDMEPERVVLLARHLMRHGLVGQAESSKGDGKQADTFDVEAYIASARVHLGFSEEEAAALSMTELWRLFRMKFPEESEKKHEVADRDEYRARMAEWKARNG